MTHEPLNLRWRGQPLDQLAPSDLAAAVHELARWCFLLEQVLVARGVLVPGELARACDVTAADPTLRLVQAQIAVRRRLTDTRPGEPELDRGLVVARPAEETT